MNHPSPIEFVRSGLPALLAAHPQVAALAERSAVVLHGSRTIGIDDGWADVDLWVLTDRFSADAFDAAHGTRFIEFTPPPRGHFNVESLEEFALRVRRCDLPLIAELRTAVVLSDPRDLSRELLACARRPMSDAVRRAWFALHYVEMRGEHRACDGAIERGDAVALMFQVSRVLQHALQGAMVLDREPYRYGKWLANVARRTPTGAAVAPLVEQTIDLIERGALRRAGPEATHPLTLKIKDIRRALIDAARAGGLDEPWLSEWWLHIDKARGGVREATW